MKYDIESIKKRKQNEKLIRRIIDIVLVILIYNVILVSISCINKIEKITVFGYRAYIIKTDSMEPSINKGDVVITKRTKEEKLKVGDVITFKQKEAVITHRIVNIENYEQGNRYITKGDNNNIEDSQKISYENIEGKCVIAIPYLGNFMGFLENRIVFLVIILILLILYFYKIQMQEKKENRREKKRIEKEKNIAS